MFYPDGLPVRLYLAPGGLPERFFVDGVRHRVQEVVRMWRVADEWWLDGIERDCYKLLTDTGLLVIVYIEEGAWFLQRIYD